MIQGILKKEGFRVTLDDQSEKLGAKVRKARQDRVPRFLVLGVSEVEQRTATLQLQDGTKVGTFEIQKLVAYLKEERPTESSRKFPQFYFYCFFSAIIDDLK